MKQVENSLDAVCIIKGKRIIDGQEHWFKSNGVLLSPFHLLTSWHCLQGLRDVSIKDKQGNNSPLLKSGKHFKKEKLDLALVELESPLGKTTVRTLNKNHPGVSENNNWLLTRFNERSALYPVKFDAYQTLKNKFRKDSMGVFSTRICIGKGFSGSPIVNQDGRVISILSETRAKSMQDLDNMEKLKGTINNKDNFFFAPEPHEFAKFIENTFLVLE